MSYSDAAATPETIAASSRARRFEGRLDDAAAIIREGLKSHPRDVRLLVELALLDDTVRDHGRMRSELANEPSIEIVICVYGALEAVKECLATVVSKTDLHYFLTIVDDASDREVGDYLAAFVASHAEARVLTNQVNLGYARSTNRGLRAARADWIVLLNSDAVVTPGWLGGLLQCALLDSSVGAVGPLSDSAHTQSIRGNVPKAIAPDEGAAIVRSLSKRLYPAVPFLSGFCTLLSKSAIEGIGYLDEANFPGYGTDEDMCLRMLDAGFKLKIADDVFVHHAKSISFGRGAIRDRRIEEARDRLRQLWPGYHPRLHVDAIESIAGLSDLKGAVRREVALRATERSSGLQRLNDFIARIRKALRLRKIKKD